jgi:hypothetical protein
MRRYAGQSPLAPYTALDRKGPRPALGLLSLRGHWIRDAVRVPPQCRRLRPTHHRYGVGCGWQREAGAACGAHIVLQPDFYTRCLPRGCGDQSQLWSGTVDGAAFRGNGAVVVADSNNSRRPGTRAWRRSAFWASIRLTASRIWNDGVNGEGLMPSGTASMLRHANGLPPGR